jgi:hypothetical protein
MSDNQTLSCLDSGQQSKHVGSKIRESSSYHIRLLIYTYNITKNVRLQTKGDIIIFVLQREATKHKTLKLKKQRSSVGTGWNRF